MTIEQNLKAKSARICVNSQLVGQLDKIASDEYRFTYDDQYRAGTEPLPLSLSLPLSSKSFSSENLPAFFDNLLMEGRLMRRLSKDYGLDARVASDRFKLLMLAAEDNIGGVTIEPLGDDGIPYPRVSQVAPKVLTDSKVAMVSAYPDRCPVCIKPGSFHPTCSQKLVSSKAPIFIAVNKEQISSTFQLVPLGASISGAQDKNLYRVRKGLFLPEIPSTHIVKPEGDYQEMPANEHLTMTIARRAKFNVPWAGLFRANDLGLLYVVKRFDREPSGERNMLEDFAQILKYMEVDKEEGSMEEIASAIDRYCTSPTIEKSDFFRRILFSFVFGNGDMHLKNWSIICDAKSKMYKLSPIYDWLNVRASMPSEKVEMVLPLAGKRLGFEKRDFEKFAFDTLKLNSKFVENSFRDISEWMAIARDLCMVSALSEKMQMTYLKIAQERSDRLAFGA